MSTIETIIFYITLITALGSFLLLYWKVASKVSIGEEKLDQTVEDIFSIDKKTDELIVKVALLEQALKDMDKWLAYATGTRERNKNIN